MNLIGYHEARQHFNLIRKLTDQEVERYSNYTPIIAEANNRFKLFRILRENYDEWISFIKNLLNYGPRNDENDYLQLDRLLLNYLTCAYTIQEHFLVSYKHRFRKDKARLDEYDAFIDRLSQNSWAFAFFLDFRGYIQHRELGISNYHRRYNFNSVEVSINCDSAQLVANSREWSRSKLTEAKGRMDLVELLNEFHHHMMNSFGNFAAKTFFPELFPAAQFYAALTKEVLEIGPGFRMFFTDDIPKPTSSDGKREMSLQLKLVPNNLFAELGLSISKSE